MSSKRKLSSVWESDSNRNITNTCKKARKACNEVECCAICLGECTNKRKISIVCPNKHVFHQSCLLKWCKNSSQSCTDYIKCPTCRQNIDLDFFDPLRYKIMKTNYNCPIKLFQEAGRFSNDLPVLRIALKRNPRLILYTDEEIKDNIEIANIVLTKDPSYIHLFGDTVKNDKTLMSSMIRKDWNHIIYIGPSLANDKDFLLSVVRGSFNYGFHIILFDQILPENLRNDSSR